MFVPTVFAIALQVVKSCLPGISKVLCQKGIAILEFLHKRSTGNFVRIGVYLLTSGNLLSII